MNISEFTSLLKHPTIISVEQTNAIENILEDYPYFQAARIVHLKGLKKQNSFKYNSALKATAAFTTNRTILFDFITADTLNATESDSGVQQLISESNVVDLEVVEESAKSDVAIAKDTTKEKIEVLEKELEIGKPLVFDISEMHSFHEWLQLASVKPIQRDKVQEPKTLKERDERFDLIEQFIAAKPKIEARSTGENVDISTESISEDKDLMTETLARVYLEQKKYDQAIRAFRILSLKYPEKSSFFADRIKAIKFLQKNNT